jgi:hypothetical protein
VIDADDGTRRRPLGVAIVAGLFVVGGAFLLATVGGNWRHHVASVEELGGDGTRFVLSLLGQGVANTAAGILMWRGSHWGWWVAAFSLCFALVRHTDTLLLVPVLAERYGASDFDEAKLYLKYGSRLASHSLILVYLFRHNVAEYFAIADASRTRRALMLVGGTVVALAISVLTAPR